MPSPPNPPPPRPRPPAGPSSPPPPPGPRVDDLWDMARLAQFLGLHVQTVKERVAARQIPFTRPLGTRSVRFTQQDVDDILAAGRVPAETAPTRDEVAARRGKARVA